MKGITNATSKATEVVQDTSKIEIGGTSLQVATDSQPGVMSAADHTTLSTTATRIGTCETAVATAQSTADTAKSTADTANTNANACYKDVSIADNVLTFTTVDGGTKDITLPSRTSNINIVPIFYKQIAISYHTGASTSARLDFTDVDIVKDDTYAVKYKQGGSRIITNPYYSDSKTQSQIASVISESEIRQMICEYATKFGNSAKITIPGNLIFAYSPDYLVEDYRATTFTAINDYGNVTISSLSFDGGNTGISVFGPAKYTGYSYAYIIISPGTITVS